MTIDLRKRNFEIKLHQGIVTVLSNPLYYNWFRRLDPATIRIAELDAMVIVNEGKRFVVTNLKNEFIDTWNVIFEDGEVVSDPVVKIGYLYHSNMR